MTAARATPEPGPRPFLGLLAGVAAGIVASAAMAAFEASAPRLIEHDDGGDTPEPRDEPSGQMIRYVAGAVMGGIYGVLTEYRPEASAGFGSAYGVATAVLDQGVVPELDPDAAAEPHPYGLASHLVYGVVLEGVRWLIAGRR